MKREQTRAFQVGNLTLGGNNHVIIQSMTNTKTKNVEATVKQIQELEDAGCEMVRMAVFDKEDAYAIADIKKQIMGRNQSVSSICNMPKEDAINGGMSRSTWHTFHWSGGTVSLNKKISLI